MADTDSTLQEYQIQLEQVKRFLSFFICLSKFLRDFFVSHSNNNKVEIALKSDSENEELLRLKVDLLVNLSGSYN
jgi:hypothetical protein